jgi:molybdenum cofactor synthesis domain-containing protein
MTAPTAALVIVGNEVLSAKVQDENGPWAARRLRELGIQLLSIHVVPDRVDDIVAAVAAQRGRVGWVFTSGGVGPTHDDITVRAVACALGRPLLRSPEMVEVIRQIHRRHHAGAEPPEAALRMADVPAGTRLLGDTGFPTLMVENVAMLPGPPRFFRYQLERIAPLLATAPFHLACIYLSVGEERFAPALGAVARQHPVVEIGSYPRFDEADHRVKVTLEARDAAAVRAARDALLAALPAADVIRVEGP